ncbi:hypothetical protein NDU88_001203 [Pleurodeles waltl]|uniref:Uncharacterized protein n=1 Tax=Pleurodeles waltl TaxID=8319 RepID=A0AAV7S991_PLEWA|nr:hypothetical protein NDU88_001203 [Pleurodeles waltl]
MPREPFRSSMGSQVAGLLLGGGRMGGSAGGSAGYKNIPSTELPEAPSRSAGQLQLYSRLDGKRLRLSTVRLSKVLGAQSVRGSSSQCLHVPSASLLTQKIPD